MISLILSVMLSSTCISDESYRCDEYDICFDLADIWIEQRVREKSLTEEQEDELTDQIYYSNRMDTCLDEIEKLGEMLVV